MTFDHVVLDDVNRALDVRSSAAGKSINVARVLQTLGESPLATGFVGGDTGRWIREELSALNIAHDFVFLPDPTRICVTMIDRSNGTATELVEETSHVSAEYWSALQAKLLQQIPTASALVLSGSIAPGAPAGFYGECCRIAADFGVATIVDARDQPLLDTLPTRPACVKPNRAELASTVGFTIDSDSSLKNAMQRMMELGARKVAVTLGGKGAAATDGTRFIRAASPKVEVVSPIGSGDSFAAGLAVSVVRGLDLEASLRLAVACGSANAMTAQAGHLDPQVVRELVDQIKIRTF